MQYLRFFQKMTIRGGMVVHIHESAENYLETILILKQKNGLVRSVDIANYLSITKPSVSVAMKAFREEGYVHMDESGFISLTQRGLAIAEKIYERHQVIAQALMSLGVSESVAYADSCKIEHDISDESFAQIKAHFLKNHDEKS